MSADRHSGVLGSNVGDAIMLHQSEAERSALMQHLRLLKVLTKGNIVIQAASGVTIKQALNEKQTLV